MSSAIEAWKQAEQQCFAYLLSITGATAQQNAFLGALPPETDAWMFQINGGPDPEYAHCTGAASFYAWMFGADLLGQYPEREQALDLVGKIIEGMPAGCNHSRNSNSFETVQTFRLNAIPTVDLQYKELTNGGKDRRYGLWEVRASFDVVANNIEQV